MGFGGFGAVVGGALQGFGGALEERATKEREAALKMLEAQQEQGLREHGYGVQHDYQGQENQQQHGFRMDENTQREDRQDTRAATEHTYRTDEEKVRGAQSRQTEGMREKFEGNQVGNYQTDGDNEVVGFDRMGHAVKTGVSTGGLNKKDSDLLKNLEPQFSQKVTTEDDTGQKTSSVKLDAKGMSQRLIDLGRPDLAKMYGGVPAPAVSLPQSGTNSAGSPSYDAGGGQQPQKLPAGMDSTAALAQARQAIASGKDRNAVIQRLRTYGIDPAGL